MDLSGMTNSVRQSRNVVKAGYVFVNGNNVHGLRDTVKVGSKFSLEIRYPNGKIQSRMIMLVNTPYPSVRNTRSNTPRELKYRG